MNWLTDEQIRRNAASQDKWDLARPHRERVTELIGGCLQPGAQRLCVLGAGNCNDLDLVRLVGASSEVHLVDLDAAALKAAVARQGVSDHPLIALHGDVDVTGVWDRLGQWSPEHPPDNPDLGRVIEQANSFSGPDVPKPFGMVASVCLLSQLVEGVVHALGERHPRFLELLRAIRHGHLRLLTQMTAPGGQGLLVTDVVSSATAAELVAIPEDALPGALTQMINARNFFHGLNPFVLTSLFKTDPVIAARVAEVQLVRPWRWDFGERVYAVTAIRFRVESSEQT